MGGCVSLRPLQYNPPRAAQPQCGAARTLAQSAAPAGKYKQAVAPERFALTQTMLYRTHMQRREKNNRRSDAWYLTRADGFVKKTQRTSRRKSGDARACTHRKFPISRRWKILEREEIIRGEGGDEDPIISHNVIARLSVTSTRDNIRALK